MEDLTAHSDRINRSRENINHLASKTMPLFDPEILKASEELDELINIYMKIRKFQG